MKNIISKIKPDSIAMELGLEAGDRLISINGTEVHDIIDYKFLITDEDIVVEIEKEHQAINGEVRSRIKDLENKCVFTKASHGNYLRLLYIIKSNGLKMHISQRLYKLLFLLSI